MSHFRVSSILDARPEGRISDLQAMAAQHPLAATFTHEVSLGATVLDDLEQYGST